MNILVTQEQAGHTIRSLLHYQLHLSTALLNHLKWQEGRIMLNGCPAHTNVVLAEGDRLCVDLRDDPPQTPTEPVKMDLDIPYEDEHLLVVNKSAPLAVHASSFAHGVPTLANGLAYYLGPDAVFHPVNRLDRGTTGLMVVAKNRYVHNLLRQALHSDTFYREYRGIALGMLTPADGTIDLPIGRAKNSPIRRCIARDGQSAVTDYETLSVVSGRSLLRLVPHTGRTHQLRVHLSALGHPLAGDWLYGTEDPDLIPRPALHACTIILRHPVTGKLISLDAPLPADMQKLLKK